MEQRTVSPPSWSGFARRTDEFRQAPDTPIYDDVERQWIAQGREVPRPGPSWGGGDPLCAGDLFHRG
ncbi:hypothetical protein [Streptomyces venezuelae]|uniref:hypothetical protein n=1 Tax=Streptomyces venezuelae TaxID=54571 RepID=UPI00331EE3E9